MKNVNGRFVLAHKRSTLWLYSKSLELIMDMNNLHNHSSVEWFGPCLLQETVAQLYE
jgi:hypothetical protein